MKLLAPQQAQTVKESERVRELLRMEEQRKEAKKIRQALANAEADFKAVLSKNRSLWAKEEFEHAKRIKEMVAEVDVLEDRKAKALIPIKMYEDQAKTLLKQAEEIAYANKLAQTELEKTQERLESKLDYLGQKEQDLSLWEKKLQSRELGVREQEAFIKESTALTTKELEKLAKLKAEVDDYIKEKERKLELREINIKSKEEQQKRTDKALSDLALQLEDERQTLERAMKRLSP